MSQLREMILIRRNQIRDQLAELTKELREAETALAALESVNTAPGRASVEINRRRYIMPASSSSSFQSEPSGPEVEPDTLDQLTIKKMIISILRPLVPGVGLSAQEIMERIRDVFGKDIERTSLSPQLSRLKNDEIIEVFENSWCIRGRAPRSGIREEEKQTTAVQGIGPKLFD